MTHTIDSVAALVQRIHIMLAEQSHGQRLVVAIAGAPGAGKSTLAEQVCSLLNRSAEQAAADAGNSPPGLDSAEVSADSSLAGDSDARQHGAETAVGGAATAGDTVEHAAEMAIVVPMDGFHLDNAILNARGQMAVKGSPPTFDINGFVALLHRLSVPDGADVYIPVFDRDADLSRNAAHCVTARHSVIIVEGNYLLLPRKGWKRLAPLFHLSVMLDVPLQTLEERLVQRWLYHGLEPEAARQRALSNDIPNARIVQEESTGAHLYFKSVRQ
ncbi:hypothetical protein ACUNV4_09920 [Granulosicoccus sp. 3-233]|uniref:hypothetical protein n=1 Tax=Granulosicoccus sp. 3-233 TaxID=3417969 RepID=UPI003D354B6B